MSGAIELSMQLLEKFLRNIQIPATSQRLNPPFAHADVASVSAPGGVAISMDYLVFVDSMTLGVPVGTGNNVLSVSFAFSRTSAQLNGLAAAGGDPMLAGLSGSVTVAVPLVFADAPSGWGGPTFVQLTADMPHATVDVVLDASGRQALQESTSGQVDAATAEAVLEGLLLGWVTSASVTPVGPPLELTGGAPSTGISSVFASPKVEFLRAPDRLRLSLQYTPSPKPPVPSTSLLPPGDSAVGIALTAEGFSDSAKRQIIHGIVRERVFKRRYDRLLKIYQEGGVTPPDPQTTLSQMAAAAAAGSLDTTEGRQELAANTPGPVGHGELVERVNPPDPFGPFDLHIHSLDLFLGEDRIIGEARGRGEIIGLDLNATMRFSVTPAVDPVSGQLILKDPIIEDPEISIDLGVLSWAFGILVTALSSLVFGALAIVGIDLLADELAEVFAADEAREKVAKHLGSSFAAGIPARMRLSAVHVSPSLLHLTGTWFVPVEVPSVAGRLRVEMTCKRRQPMRMGARPKTVYVGCMGDLGILGGSEEGNGEPFKYWVHEAASDLTARIESTHIPLPLRDIEWTVSMSSYRPSNAHSSGGGVGPVPLSAGILHFTLVAWRPDPPFFGDDTKTVDVDVTATGGPSAWELIVSKEATSVRLSVTVTAVDHTGSKWSASANEIVSSRWISWGEATDRLERLRAECERQREIPRGSVGLEERADPLARVWNPPPERELIELGRTGLRPEIGERTKLVELAGIKKAVQAVATRRRMM